VLLAGKGHENYQIIGDKTFEFETTAKSRRRDLRERGLKGRETSR